MTVDAAPRTSAACERRSMRRRKSAATNDFKFNKNERKRNLERVNLAGHTTFNGESRPSQSEKKKGWDGRLLSDANSRARKFVNWNVPKTRLTKNTFLK